MSLSNQTMVYTRTAQVIRAIFRSLARSGVVMSRDTPLQPQDTLIVGTDTLLSDNATKYLAGEDKAEVSESELEEDGLTLHACDSPVTPKASIEPTVGAQAPSTKSNWKSALKQTIKRSGRVRAQTIN